MWKRKTRAATVQRPFVSCWWERADVLLGLILPTPILPKLYLQRRKRKAVDPNLEDFTAGNGSWLWQHGVGWKEILSSTSGSVLLTWLIHCCQEITPTWIFKTWHNISICDLRWNNRHHSSCCEKWGIKDRKRAGPGQLSWHLWPQRNNAVGTNRQQAEEGKITSWYFTSLVNPSSPWPCTTLVILGPWTRLWDD